MTPDSTPTDLSDDRRRALALLLAAATNDEEGVRRLLGDDLIPHVRSFHTDPLGSVLDEKRAKPVAAMVGELVALAFHFAVRAYGTEEAAVEAIGKWLRDGEADPPW